jgi:hypothetical protein
MTSAPTRATNNYNPDAVITSGSSTGSAFIAFRDAETNQHDFCGAFLIGNNDTSGAEGHFCGMWAEAEADGKMNLFLSGERYKFENDDPHVTIDKDGHFYVHRQQYDANNSTRAGVKIHSSAIGDTNGGMIYVWAPSTDVMQFRNTSNSSALVGTIAISTTATSYNTSSDYRLKENVVALTGATERLKQLNPSRFNFIADADTTVDGFLAHEVQSVVPEAITGTHNEVEVWQEHEELPEGVSIGDTKLDDDGNTTPVYQGIDQSKLVPLLVATIQELEARIAQLENA